MNPCRQLLQTLALVLGLLLPFQASAGFIKCFQERLLKLVMRSKTITTSPDQFRVYFKETTEIVSKSMNRGDKPMRYFRLKHDGDPSIAFLERLGFRFLPDKVQVPKWEEVLAEYEKVLDEHVKAGRLSAENKLTPAIPYWDPKLKKVVPISIHETPPAKAMVHTQILTRSEYGDFLAKGHLPVSWDNSKLGSPTQEIMTVEHELNHLIGMGTHPEYMDDLARLARQTPSNDPLWSSYEFFYLNESMVSINAKSAEDLADRIGIEKRFIENPTLTVTEMRSYLENLSVPERISHIEKLKSEYRRLVKPFGGSNADYFSASDASLKDWDGLEYLWRQFELTGGDAFSPLTNSDLDLLARINTGIILHFQHSPSDWIKQMQAGTLRSEGSFAVHLICLSGFIKDPLKFKMLCRRN